MVFGRKCPPTDALDLVKRMETINKIFGPSLDPPFMDNVQQHLMASFSTQSQEKREGINKNNKKSVPSLTRF